MTRWAMVIELERCTVCRSCIAACKLENNVPISSPQDVEKGRCINWIEFSVEQHETGDGFRETYLPRPCMHCSKPPCTKVCPVNATYPAEDGLVGQIYPRCIGCRYCMNNCPFSVKKFNWDEPRWPKNYVQARNPDVSARPKGVVEKCSFCHHRWQKEKERAHVENRPPDKTAFRPACMESCPAHAIHFGDLDEPGGEIAGMTTSSRAFRLLEELGTEPKVWYIAEGEE